MRQRLETEPGIKSERIPGPEHEPPQALQPGMRAHRGHKLFTDTLSSFVFDNEDIRQPGERRKISHDPRKTNLLPRLINTKTQRMVQGAVYRLRRHALCPITALAEKPMDQFPVQPRRIVRNQQRRLMYLVCFVCFHGNKKAPPALPAGPGNFQRD